MTAAHAHNGWYANPLPTPVLDAGPACHPGIGDLFTQPSRAEVTAGNQQAMRVCNGDPAAGTGPCPARAQCLAWAVRYDEDGVWGGTTWRQRRDHGAGFHDQPETDYSRRRRRVDAGDPAVPHGTVSGYKAWGCRCDPCKAAHAAYQAARPGRRRA